MATVKIDRRLYMDVDGNLVEHGDPSAAFLWAAEGSEVHDDEAERMGYQPSGTSSKAVSKPSDKQTSKPSDKAVEPSDGHVCDECGFEAKSAGGLGAHQRTHEDD